MDYFLFDSKVGYCDNFSTSMVVLLRTLGIPARWTKGFTNGLRTGTDNQGNEEYSILNSHAHSWPEVYFPGFGWLPFEPTPSFANPMGSQPVAETTETVQPAIEQPNESENMQKLFPVRDLRSFHQKKQHSHQLIKSSYSALECVYPSCCSFYCYSENLCAGQVILSIFIFLLLLIRLHIKNFLTLWKHWYRANPQNLCRNIACE